MSTDLGREISSYSKINTAKNIFGCFTAISLFATASMGFYLAGQNISQFKNITNFQEFTKNPLLMAFSALCVATIVFGIVFFALGLSASSKEKNISEQYDCKKIGNFIIFENSNPNNTNDKDLSSLNGY